MQYEPRSVYEFEEAPRVPDARVALLRRYLDQHCAIHDQDGLGALCECRICVETRAVLAELEAPRRG